MSKANATKKKKKPKIFLSYARPDQDQVRKVADQLREAGVRVWDPEFDVLPGGEWASELQSALESATAMVVFISPAAMASREVSHEITYALGAKHFRGRLIPVILQDAADAPWILNSLQPIRYADPNQTSSQILETLSRAPNVPQATRIAT